jgi:hypothetical protein
MRIDWFIVRQRFRDGYDRFRNRRGVGIGAGAVAGLVVVIVAFRVLAGGPDPAVTGRERVAIDAETGRVFERYRIRPGDSTPWTHPRTGRATLYPAEACYWAADGGVKLEPTYVLVNEYIGREGPTMCPDCGERVVPRNPMPPLELMAAAAEGR